MRKIVFSFLLAAFPLLTQAAPPDRGVLVSPQSGPLGSRQRNLEDRLQKQHREQIKYQEEVSGVGQKQNPVMKQYQDERAMQERRLEIQRKELEEGASPQTTLRRTLDDRQEEARRASSFPPSASSHSPARRSVAVTGKRIPGEKPQHYERERATHRLQLQEGNEWSFNQRIIGKKDLKDRLTMLSQERPVPKLEVTFGSEVPKERREEVLQECRRMGFSEIAVQQDAPPKQKVAKRPPAEPSKTYHWWQPEWWIRPD